MDGPPGPAERDAQKHPNRERLVAIRLPTFRLESEWLNMNKKIATTAALMVVALQVEWFAQADTPEPPGPSTSGSSMQQSDTPSKEGPQHHAKAVVVDSKGKVYEVYALKAHYKAPGKWFGPTPEKLAEEFIVLYEYSGKEASDYRTLKIPLRSMNRLEFPRDMPGRYPARVELRDGTIITVQGTVWSDDKGDCEGRVPIDELDRCKPNGLIKREYPNKSSDTIEFGWHFFASGKVHALDGSWPKLLLSGFVGQTREGKDLRIVSVRNITFE